MDDFFSSFERSMERAEEYRQRRDNMLDRLRVEPCMKEAEIGSKVLVYCAFIDSGRGHLHELLECEVVAKSDIAYKIRGQKSYDKEPWESWVMREVIADVLTDGVITNATT